MFSHVHVAAHLCANVLVVLYLYIQPYYIPLIPGMLPPNVAGNTECLFVMRPGVAAPHQSFPGHGGWRFGMRPGLCWPSCLFWGDGMGTKKMDGIGFGKNIEEKS